MLSVRGGMWIATTAARVPFVPVGGAAESRLRGGGPPGLLQVPRVDQELHVGCFHGRKDAGKHPVIVVPAVPAHAERPAERPVAPPPADQQAGKTTFQTHLALF